MRPLKKTRRATEKDNRLERCESGSGLEKAELDRLVNECLQQLLLRVDRDFELEKYSRKCEEINSELDILVKDEATLGLKLERMLIAD